MSLRRPITRFDLTSPVWRWGTLLLALAFIAFSTYLLTTINRQSEEVRKNVHAITSLNKLKKSVRSLSRALISGQGSQPASWQMLYNSYERSRAAANMEYAREMSYEEHLSSSDRNVAKMAYLYDELTVKNLTLTEKEMLYQRFLSHMNVSLDELEIAIDIIGASQGMHSQQLNNKLNVLGWLVFVACLLAIFITALFSSYQRDMAARRKAEEALEKASAEIFDLYNNAPCGYHSLDSKGIFVDINETELGWLGYKREEIIGKMSFTDVLTPGSAELFARQYSAFIIERKTIELEFTMVRKNQTTFPVLLRAIAIYDEAGNYVKSRSTVLDITKRKMVEEENDNKNIAILNAYKKLEHTARELATVNKELESFSYSVSHDLRAPLRAINSYSQILEEEYGSKLDAEGLRLLGVVKGSAKKMGILIDDLLALARLGKQEVRKSAVDMNELVNAVIRDLERNQQKLEVRFEVEDLPPAWGDYSLLTQVVYNLLSNAVKYSSKKSAPLVIVGAKALAEEHIYYVKDNGAGFDMKYADKLFGVFQRLHHINEFEGTGVGLAIVHRIITRHGGRIWAEGEPGEGAVFYFSLPVK